MNNLIETDVLIIGCGIAGGTAALQLADAGVAVTLITRATAPESSNTNWAQGGIVYEGQNDSPQLLAEDIDRAGAQFTNPEAVNILAEEGPQAVRDILLSKIGVPFDREANGDLSLVIEGSHAVPRIIHATDATGRAIEVALLNALQAHPNVTLLAGHTAIDLLTPNHNGKNRLSVYKRPFCVGAYLLNRATGQVRRCLAKKTVLATGGLGQIFLRTSNPKGARGDGLAMAYRAGARVINCEFIQFHPTTFFKRGAPSFLISEAARGEGARLVHGDKRPFMDKYDPEWKDLAPRDIVARAINQELIDHDLQNLFLDFGSYISRPQIEHHFPNIMQQCLKHGVDIRTDLVPIVPGAHYFCGGVWVDAWGRTTIEQLYAVGEVSCTGLHGANRLASTSLLEGLVWGDRAARDIAATLSQHTLHPSRDIPAWQTASGTAPDPVLIAQDMRSVQQVMWNYVGIVRTKTRLLRAQRELRNLETEIEQFYRKMPLTDGLIGLRNAVRAAILVARAAWSNKQSVGAHYREN